MWTAPDLHGAQSVSATKIKIEVAGQTTDGILYRPALPEGKAPAVLFIHGWDSSGDDLSDAAEALCSLGCLALTFDLRGNNREDEQFDVVSREDSLQDVLAAYDFLVAQAGVDVSRVGVVGISYGGYLGVLLSSHRKVRWLALRVPALYEDRDFDKPKLELSKIHDLVTFRHKPLDPEENTALASLAQFHGPVLIIESGEDQVIPHPQIRNYLNAAGQRSEVSHRVMAGADHALSRATWRKEFVSLLTHWFRERLTA